MENVAFLQGASENLPSKGKEGSFYVTNDKYEMFLADKNGDLHRISKQYWKTFTAIPEPGPDPEPPEPDKMIFYIGGEEHRATPGSTWADYARENSNIKFETYTDPTGDEVSVAFFGDTDVLCKPGDDKTTIQLDSYMIEAETYYSAFNYKVPVIFGANAETIWHLIPNEIPTYISSMYGYYNLDSTNLYLDDESGSIYPAYETMYYGSGSVLTAYTAPIIDGNNGEELDTINMVPTCTWEYIASINDTITIEDQGAMDYRVIYTHPRSGVKYMSMDTIRKSDPVSGVENILVSKIQTDVSFTLDGTEYNVPQGTTWKQLVEGTDISIDGYTCGDFFVHSTSHISQIIIRESMDSYAVRVNDVICEEEYSTSLALTHWVTDLDGSRLYIIAPHYTATIDEVAVVNPNIDFSSVLYCDGIYWTSDIPSYDQFCVNEDNLRYIAGYCSLHLINEDGSFNDKEVGKLAYFADTTFGSLPKVNADIYNDTYDAYLINGIYYTPSFESDQGEDAIIYEGRTTISVIISQNAPIGFQFNNYYHDIFIRDYFTDEYVNEDGNIIINANFKTPYKLQDDSGAEHDFTKIVFTYDEEAPAARRMYYYDSNADSNVLVAVVPDSSYNLGFQFLPEMYRYSCITFENYSLIDQNLRNYLADAAVICGVPNESERILTFVRNGSSAGLESPIYFMSGMTWGEWMNSEYCPKYYVSIDAKGYVVRSTDPTNSSYRLWRAENGVHSYIYCACGQGDTDSFHDVQYLRPIDLAADEVKLVHSSDLISDNIIYCYND